MKSNSPPHEKVAQRAQEIWKARGSPGGQDTEIWLEAERQLSTTVAAQNSPSIPQGQSSATVADHKPANLVPGHPSTHPVPSRSPAEAAARDLQQKKEARAPQLPDAKSAHPPTPPQSGKPLWDKPHSK